MQTVSDSIHSYMSKLKTMPPKQTVFSAKKQKILQELNRPEEEYTDLSPIGAVDPNIRQLVNQINEAEGYVTTSSCAGRISVFLEGAGNVKIDHGNHHDGNDDDHDTGSTNISSSSSQQGKGGGKWLFVSHDPVNLTDLEEKGKLLELFQLPNGGNAENSFSATAPPPQVKVRFVHFKFEPMILHILTSSLASAQHCLSSAVSAGFRESGITSITGTEPTPNVGIRTQGLALESIIAWQDSDSGKIHPMVSEAYLRTLVELANQRFGANQERKERFARALLQSKGEEVRKGDAGDWEPKDVRRERKREEGLRRKEEIQRQQRQKADAESKGGQHHPEKEEEEEVFGSFGLQETVANGGDPLPAEKPRMMGERGHGPVVHQKKHDA